MKSEAKRVRKINSRKIEKQKHVNLQIGHRLKIVLRLSIGIRRGPIFWTQNIHDNLLIIRRTGKEENAN